MRINIYVGEDLKARMDAAKDSTNWSEVACRAFEAELGAIAARKADKNMDDVIQRLKASKQARHQAAAEAGYQDGKHWAMHRAEYAQLERLAKQDEINNSEGFDWDWHGVALTALGDAYAGLSCSDALAELNLEDGVADDDAAAEGFVRGAVDVFEAVADQL